MTADLVEIQPESLRFVFEPHKQSSCSVRLTNKSDHYVAYKIKTTIVKMFSVKPNVGIIQPGSMCQVTVIRRAQHEIPPPNAVPKEKFLFQTAFVPEDTAIGSIKSIFSSKDGGKDNINQKMLRVDVVGSTTTLKRMEAKIQELDSRLREAEETIRKLKEETKIQELDSRLREAEETIRKLKEETGNGDFKRKKRSPFVFIKCFNAKLA